MLCFAVIIHVAASIFLDEEGWRQLVYIRNQFVGVVFLASCVQVSSKLWWIIVSIRLQALFFDIKWLIIGFWFQILDFLQFHHVFGPWAIIIVSLVGDAMKFMVILTLFLVGYSMLVMAVNQPYKPSMELTNDLDIANQIIDDELAGCK